MPIFNICLEWMPPDPQDDDNYEHLGEALLRMGCDGWDATWFPLKECTNVEGSMLADDYASALRKCAEHPEIETAFSVLVNREFVEPTDA